MNKLKTFFFAHKIVSVVVVAILAYGGYTLYKKNSVPPTVTKYVVQKATQGTVIASVSGSGQVAAGITVDVKPQTSENVQSVAVKVGQHVTAGQLLVQLDTTNEAKAVRQAQLSLQSAELSLAKLNEAPATTTLAQSEDAVTQAQESLATASSSLERDYETGFDTLATSFVDFQNVILGLQDFDNGNSVNHNQSNPDAYVNLLPSYLAPSALPYRSDVQATFSAAMAAYGANLSTYHASTRDSSSQTLDALFAQANATAKTMSDAVKSSKALLNYVVDNYPSASSTNPLPSVTNTFETNLASYTNTMNNDVSSLSNLANTIASDKTSINDAALSLKEKQESLAALQAGPDSLDVQSQQISIQGQQMSLENAQETLAEDSIRAPISGIVSSIPSIVGEAAPSPAVSVISDGEVAQTTLNEVDAAKVQVGDKATLSFDAISGLSLAGEVAELDPVGTVTQGVVNYNVKISFSDSSGQVKPGMSVSAVIDTQVDNNIIAVPNAAIVTQGGTSYVLEPAAPLSDADITTSATGGILLSTAPTRVPVTVGISNDTLTEVTAGINPGDQIIVRSITSGGTASASTASTGNALRLGGAAGGLFGGATGGGGIRTGGGAATGR